MNKTIEIKNENIESKCGWTPFMDINSKVHLFIQLLLEILKCKMVKLLGDPEGTPLKFS